MDAFLRYHVYKNGTRKNNASDHGCCRHGGLRCSIQDKSLALFQDATIESKEPGQVHTPPPSWVGDLISTIAVLKPQRLQHCMCQQSTKWTTACTSSRSCSTIITKKKITCWILWMSPYIHICTQNNSQNKMCTTLLRTNDHFILSFYLW